MSYTDHAATARSYVATAAQSTRRAKRDAQTAADFYALADSWKRHAAWYTSHPDLVRSETAAHCEQNARSWGRSADAMLRSSFHATRTAQFYRELAAKYREMAARHALQVAV